MSTADYYATLGAPILLSAFVAKQRRWRSAHSPPFLAMNLRGAAICAYAAWMARFIPFLVLEAVWALVAGRAWLRSKREAQT
jgi:hypothetical protein